MRVIPRLQTKLLGHEDTIKVFLDSFSSGRLHHALMFCGRNGIGKATLAYKAIKFLLSNQEKDHKHFNISDAKTESLVNTLTHPDLMVVEDGKITVDLIREVKEFIYLKSINSKYRVVLIDSVDSLNISASNALLKVLEDPPDNAIIMLVCHDRQSVLPTILSRCAIFKMHSLSYELFERGINNQKPDAVKICNIEHLYKVSYGSIGKALDMCENGFFEIYTILEDIISEKRYDKVKSLMELSSDDKQWDMISVAIIQFFLEKLKTKALDGNLREEHFEFIYKIKKYIDDVNLFHLSRAGAITAIFG